MEIKEINPDKISSSSKVIERNSITFFRTLAMIMLFVGAIGSLGFMFHGRHNDSFLLVGLFTIWVLSPFVVLFLANFTSRSWSYLTRIKLYILILFISLTTLISYSGVLNPNNMKPAFIYLIVPFISWVIIVIILSIAILSRKVR